MSEDAGIEPRTIVTLALAARRSNHSAVSHFCPLFLAYLYDLKYPRQTLLLDLSARIDTCFYLALNPNPDPHVLGLPDPDPSISKQK